MFIHPSQIAKPVKVQVIEVPNIKTLQGNNKPKSGIIYPC